MKRSLLSKSQLWENAKHEKKQTYEQMEENANIIK